MPPEQQQAAMASIMAAYPGGGVNQQIRDFLYPNAMPQNDKRVSYSAMNPADQKAFLAAVNQAYPNGQADQQLAAMGAPTKSGITAMGGDSKGTFIQAPPNPSGLTTLQQQLAAQNGGLGPGAPWVPGEKGLGQAPAPTFTSPADAAAAASATSGYNFPSIPGWDQPANWNQPGGGGYQTPPAGPTGGAPGSPAAPGNIPGGAPQGAPSGPSAGAGGLAGALAGLTGSSAPAGPVGASAGGAGATPGGTASMGTTGTGGAGTSSGGTGAQPFGGLGAPSGNTPGVGSGTVGTTATDPNNPLTAQTLAVGALNDPVKMAQQAYQTMQASTDPQYQAQLRDALRSGAAAGGLGSGTLNTSLGDISNQRQLALTTEQQNLLQQALQQQNQNAYANVGIAQQQQGFQAGQQGTAFNQQLQMAQQQAAQNQQAYGQALGTAQLQLGANQQKYNQTSQTGVNQFNQNLGITQQQQSQTQAQFSNMENALNAQGQTGATAFAQALSQLTSGMATSPAQMQLTLSALFGGQASQAQAALTQLTQAQQQGAISGGTYNQLAGAIQSLIKSMGG